MDVKAEYTLGLRNLARPEKLIYDNCVKQMVVGDWSHADVKELVKQTRNKLMYASISYDNSHYAVTASDIADARLDEVTRLLLLFLMQSNTYNLV